MKRKLFLLLCALLTMIGVQAQETPTNDGIYYLYNSETDLFLSRGNDWGTQAVAKPVALPWKVSVSDGKYTLRMYDLTVAGSTTGFGSNGFTDNGSPIAFTPSGNATDGFTLKNGDNYITCPATAGVVTLSTTASAWKFLTQDQYNAVLAARVAAQESAVAAAKDIVIPAGKTLNDVVSDADNWASTFTNDGMPTSDKWTATNHTPRGDQHINWGNYGTEMYQVCNGHYTRTITGLKKGIYKVSARGMKRMGNNATCTTMGNAGYPVSDTYLTANGNVIRFKAWYEDRVSDSNPNSTDDFVNIVNNGGYITEGFVYVADDGNLTLNASSEAFWGGSWFLFNGISYTYYNNEVSDEDAAAIIAQAQGITGAMNADVKTTLDNALATFQSSKTIANYNVLSEAITAANNSIAAYANAKAYLDEAATILAGTNVYTATSYENLYTTPLAKYEARTLTNEEGNALVKTSTGWHSNNTIDEILLSAWTIGGNQCHKFDTSLYINTWSTEGATDGSEFLAPFFEYWVGDGDVLGANTIVATVAGLNPNATYSFTIRARVRQTNNKTKIANGVTMKVGAGEAVDISAGAKFNTTPFYIGNFTAVGETDADGKLTMTMTVAENSNISWLSFYNAKWTEGEDLSAYIADYEFAKSTAIANRDNDAYAAVTGKERVDLVNTITTYSAVDVTSKAALIEAKEALDAASNTFVAAAPAYIGIAELNPNVAAKLGVALPEITSETVAADLDVNAIIVAEYNAGKAYAQDFTNKLGDWTDAPGTNKGQSWNGTTGDDADTYYDEYNRPDRAMTQTVTLPKGDYALIAKGRASANGRLTLVVGSETVTFPHKSDVGRGIATDGAATFADNAIYANNNAGRGWEYRVMTFTSDGATPITLTFNWKTSSYNWCGLDDIELLCNPAALDYSALQTAYDAVVVPTLGFEAGEYAPYNNKENLENISIAKNLLDNKDADNQETIDNATAAITGMTWTANIAEVNAFYKGDFDGYAEDTSSPLDYTPNGWTATANFRLMLKNVEDYPGLADASVGTAPMSWSGGITYGETAGYEMPLKANTIYRLQFKAAGWNNETRSGMSVSILNGTDGMALYNLGTPDRDIKGNATNVAGMTSYDVVFATGAAGNYVFHIQSGNNFVVTDFSITKAASQTLTITDGEALPKFAPGTYPSATYTRTIPAESKYGTICLPFNVKSDENITFYNLESVEGTTLNLTSADEGVAAGVPAVFKKLTAVAEEISVTTANAEVVAAPVAQVGDTKLVGTFSDINVSENVEKCYYIKSNAFWQGNSNFNVKAYRAYIQTDVNEARLIIKTDGEDPTAINAIEAAEAEDGALKDGKYLIDGKIVIVKNGVKYSANGQKLN